MEIKELVQEKGIIGVISNYQNTLKKIGRVSDLLIHNMDNALKMVGLDSSYKDKLISDLTLSEYFKVDLMTKLREDVIIVGNLSLSLNYKEQEYMKKLLLKLYNEYHKKIVVIDNDVKVFFGLVKCVIVLKNKEIIFETDDFFQDELYKYTKCPEIIKFIKYVNQNQKRLQETTDIYELIKDIYRSV